MNKSTDVQDISKAIQDFKAAIENIEVSVLEQLGLNFEDVVIHLNNEELKIAEHNQSKERLTAQENQEELIVKENESETLKSTGSVESEIADYNQPIQDHLDEITAEEKVKEEMEAVDSEDEVLNELQSEVLAFEDKTMFEQDSDSIEDKNLSALPEEINIAGNPNDDIVPIMENMAKIKPDESFKSPKPEEKLFVARNAMVGKNYSLQLSEINELDTAQIDEILELEELGLVYDAEEKTISGTPHDDGEFACPITYKQGHNPLFSSTLRILVNPDPRSLWKNLEPPTDALYQKSHFDFHCQSFDQYNVVAGSHRGRSHAHSGTFRDDDFVIQPIGSNMLFIAVADGAGSSEYSREGSKIACDNASHSIVKGLEVKGDDLLVLAQKLDDDRKDKVTLDALTSQVYSLISEAVMNARNGLISKSEEAGHELKEYSTTLLFSLILKLKDSFFVASYSIGDGIIAHISDSVKLLSVPDGGQFAGQTRFLTMPEAIEDLAKRMKVTFVKDLNGLYLMTDGISDPFFDTDAQMGELEPWNKLKTSIAQDINFADKNVEEQFKEWINFWSPGNHDDRTIAFVGHKINA